jgi:glycosyltransferase involved in cell wall biosynthesis
MKHPIIFIFSALDIKEVLIEKIENPEVVTLFFYEDDSNFMENAIKYIPDIILTIDPRGDSQFKNIYNSDLWIRKRWIHLNNIENFSLYGMYYCYMYNVINHKMVQYPRQDVPLITLFTPSYKSGDKIMRPFHSLLSQTYPYWEWIIINDSPDTSEDLDKDDLNQSKNESNWSLLKSLKEKDSRIKIIDIDKNTANIGNLKFASASLARGKYLCELDHDDDLSNDCLELVVKAFQQYPEAGFVYTDFCELYENTYAPFGYGPYFGLGYGTYYAQKINIREKEIIGYVCPSFNLNSVNLQDIVGVPNHLRVWSKKFYQEIEGHAPLPVADDYELLLRTFLHTQMVRIPHCCYFQYRNTGGNTTFTRNGLIRMLQAIAKDIHWNNIEKKLDELGIPNQGKYYNPKAAIYDQPYNYIEQHRTLHYKDSSLKNTISIIVSVYRENSGILQNSKNLRRCLDSLQSQFYTDFEVFVIGDGIENLDKIMEDYNDDRRFRWWKMYNIHNDRGVTCKNYALRSLIRTDYITYIEEDEYWFPEHLTNLKNALDQSPRDFVVIDSKFSNLKNKSLIHKRDILYEKGFWNTQAENSLIEFLNRIS